MRTQVAATHSALAIRSRDRRIGKLEARVPELEAQIGECAHVGNEAQNGARDSERKTRS